MIIRDALWWGRQQLATAPAPSPTPAGDARLLLQHILDVTRTTLVAHDDRPLTAVQERRFRALIARARQGEPIPYLTGTAPFYDLDFHVTPAVLIPRPETELLVEAALAWAEANQAQHVVDVGTGSGCIAIVLALRLPHARVDATDVSADALAVARQNALRHKVVSRVHFHHGSLLAPVPGTPDLIVANLPYVTDAEWTTLADGVKWYEPVGALRGGPAGLDQIGQLLSQARATLRAGGAIFLEIGWQQGQSARDLARASFPAAHIAVIPDHAGHDRIVSIETE